MARVEVRLGEAERALERLSAKTDALERRVLSRSLTSTRAFLAREIAGDLGLRVGIVREEIKPHVDVAGHVARLSVAGARIPLVQFSARGPQPSRGRGSGVRYRIGARAGHIPRGFIATMRSGHRGVFERADKAGRPLTTRLPIQEKFGPSLPHVFVKFTPAALAFGGEQLQKNLAHELRFALAQKG